jgi:hypothetical protein
MVRFHQHPVREKCRRNICKKNIKTWSFAYKQIQCKHKEHTHISKIPLVSKQTIIHKFGFLE